MSETVEHANVEMALGAAQVEMGKLVKGSTNSAFKRPDGKPSTYADLADVVEAVRAPFANNGLAYYHTIKHFSDLGTCLVTILVHGKSGTSIECPVPLIVDKNNMHGFKSATTYAKRIGIESVSGIAPEDDDGNAASKAAPKAERPAKPATNGTAAPASFSSPKAVSAAEMKRVLNALPAELADCFSTVAVDALLADYEYGMERDNWPGRDPDGDFYEQSYPCQIRRMINDRRVELEKLADAQVIREPNILMAGE
jgi:hypothetical protein